MEILNVFIRPSAFSINARIYPMWGYSFALIAIFLGFVSYFQMPVAIQYTIDYLYSKGFSEADVNVIIKATERIQYLNYILRPLVVLMLSFTYSTLVYLGVKAFGYNILFPRVFSLTINCSIIILLSMFVNMVALLVVGYDNIITQSDFNLVGLHNLFPNMPTGILQIFLSHLDFFVLWFVLVISYALSCETAIPKLTSFGVSSVSSLILILLMSVINSGLGGLT